MTLKEYLRQRHAESTANRYYRDILIYLEQVGQDKAIKATYGDIMDYIGQLRKKYSNPATIKCTLHGIKKYYFWLNHTGQRTTHPCRALRIKDKTSRDVQIQDLFKPEELEQLMERKERFRDTRIRNKVVISLLIYQGLTRGDIVRLTLNDINLDEGTIYIKAGVKTNSRTLKLKPRQIMLFYKYLNEVRPKLISYRGKKRAKAIKPGETDAFILTVLGSPETGEGISHVIETLKPLFPDRTLNAKTIRQSVIANLLKSGHGLRLVQTFAGHKYPSTTEKYRQTGIEELKKAIYKYHPLGERG